MSVVKFMETLNGTEKRNLQSIIFSELSAPRLSLWHMLQLPQNSEIKNKVFLTWDNSYDSRRKFIFWVEYNQIQTDFKSFTSIL